MDIMNESFMERPKKKFDARIIINDQNNDGKYSKSFILKLLDMGALIIVEIDGMNLYLQNEEDLKEFKKLK